MARPILGGATSSNAKNTPKIKLKNMAIKLHKMVLPKPVINSDQ